MAMLSRYQAWLGHEDSRTTECYIRTRCKRRGAGPICPATRLPARYQAVFGPSRDSPNPLPGENCDGTMLRGGRERKIWRVGEPEEAERVLPRTGTTADRKGGAQCVTKSTKNRPFEPMSKRRRGYPSETHVKVGVRVVHGEKLLEEKLGRNDLCPCGSNKRLKQCCLRKGRF